MEVFVNPIDREYVETKALGEAINDFGWNSKKFAKACTTYNRTLKQPLFISIVEILICFAKEKSRTDAGNKASKEGAKRIIEVLKAIHTPYI